MTAAQIAELASISEAEMIALAYEEAADGDACRALRQAIEDVIALEMKLAAAESRVSRGYVRGALPDRSA